MSTFLIRWLNWLYAQGLKLYPNSFRAEFGAEMETVFAQRLMETGLHGWWALFMVCLRELRDWPSAVWHAHWPTGRYSMFSSPAVRRETLLAFAPFLSVGLMVLISPLLYPLLPEWLNNGLGLVIALGLMGLMLVGLARGVPRWVLPYLGFWAGLASLTLFRDGGSTTYFGLFNIPALWGIFAGFGAMGQLWLGTLTLVAASILLLALIPPTHRLYRRLSADWSQVSFLLYGAMVIGLLHTFDEYTGDELVFALAMVTLTLGGWAYLRSQTTLSRALSLLGGICLTMLVVSVSKWLLFPLQFSWPQDSLTEANRWGEFTSSLTMGGWMAVAILLPCMLNAFNRPADPQLNPSVK